MIKPGLPKLSLFLLLLIPLNDLAAAERSSPETLEFNAFHGYRYSIVVTPLWITGVPFQRRFRDRTTLFVDGHNSATTPAAIGIQSQAFLSRRLPDLLSFSNSDIQYFVYTEKLAESFELYEMEIPVPEGYSVLTYRVEGEDNDFFITYLTSEEVVGNLVCIINLRFRDSVDDIYVEEYKTLIASFRFGEDMTREDEGEAEMSGTGETDDALGQTAEPDPQPSAAQGGRERMAGETGEGTARFASEPEPEDELTATGGDAEIQPPAP